MERFSRDRQQAAAKTRAEIEKVRKEASKAALASLASKVTEAVNAEKRRAYAEKLALTTQHEDMQRRLEKQTAAELGGPAEADPFEALLAEFEKLGDRLARIPRGQAGADIVHDVIHNGAAVGRIIYDSKNHKRWLNNFTTKLRFDMVHHKADHSILSSSAFPAGARQIHIQDGVVVAAPARVTVLAQLLRRQIILVHTLRVSNEAREEKRHKLYDFITSDRCVRLLDRIGTLSNEISELDAKEESTHRTVWKRRTEIINAIQGAHGEFVDTTDRIIRAEIALSPRD